MSYASLEHRIRIALGKAFHHKHHTGAEGAVDIGNIASEHNVSEDQVKEQLAFLHANNVLSGPLALEGEHTAGVPAAMYHDVHITDAGLGWAAAGYPVL
jgi:hypothetical protein